MSRWDALKERKSGRRSRANWPLCLVSFDAAFRGNQANCEFALLF
jgi:hypothetical protein